MRTGKRVGLWLVVACATPIACSDGGGKSGVGDPCEDNTDCQDEICHLGICASNDPLKNGEACKLAAECRSFRCTAGSCVQGTRSAGELCLFGEECLSETCQALNAAPGVCTDGSPISDGAVPDAGPPDALQPDAPQPDTLLPDALQPDALQPDTLQPDAPQSDTLQPDAPQPDTLLPDAPQPDTLLPDTLQPDALQPDTLQPDQHVNPDFGPCGDKNQPCCGSLCNAPLACIAGSCVCGAQDQPCCSGDLCDANLTCTSSKTCACGGLDQACCGGSTCNGALYCAGQACACIKALDGDHYIRTDGTVWNQQAATYSVPIAVSGPLLTDAVQVLAGFKYGCARKSDGTVWCWARSTDGNAAGQLGNGSLGGTTTGHNATQVQAAGGGFLTDVTNISAAGSGSYLVGTTCAVKSDTTIWCWGNAQSGSTSGLFQKINDTHKPLATQILASPGVPLSGASQVSLKQRHACAVVTGSVACWGTNIFGQLGAGDTSPHLYPVLVTIPGKTAKKVSVGSDVSCALTTGGEVYCWGVNTSGQCGLGYTSNSVTGPVQVVQDGGGSLTGVKDIAVGHLMACAVKTDGSLWCWGKPNNLTYTKATQMLDKNSAHIDDVTLVTTNTAGLDYRILKTNAEYWQNSSQLAQTKMTYSCP